MAEQERSLRLRVGGVRLDADLSVPPAATAVVAFAHGTGSSRFSPRNRQVAAGLRAAGYATLLMDLLTPDEEAQDARSHELRFDIPRLATRLADTVDWLADEPATTALPVALFGASTGAAAALVAATHRPDRVRTVVSRGGRPDLAGDALRLVRAPTLLVVGGDDGLVLELNEEAASRMVAAPVELAVVEGATHLFEEPGTLDEVLVHAVRWLGRWVGGTGGPG